MQNQSLRRTVFAAASFAAIATAAPDTAVHATATPARHTSVEAVFISHMVNPPGPGAQLTPPAPNS